MQCVHATPRVTRGTCGPDSAVAKEAHWIGWCGGRCGRDIHVERVAREGAVAHIAGKANAVAGLCGKGRQGGSQGESPYAKWHHDDGACARWCLCGMICNRLTTCQRVEQEPAYGCDALEAVPRVLDASQFSLMRDAVKSGCTISIVTLQLQTHLGTNDRLRDGHGVCMVTTLVRYYLCVLPNRCGTFTDEQCFCCHTIIALI